MGKTMQTTLTKGILDIITQFLMNHKQWPFQTSTFDVLRLFLKFKVPGLSQNIVLQFLEHSRNVVFDTQSSTVKVAAIEFLEAAILIFPLGTSSKWQDIRDTVRTLLTDTDPDVVTYACRLFSLLFACCPINLSEIAFEYLKTDLYGLMQNKDSKVVDPTEVQLQVEEKERKLVYNFCPILTHFIFRGSKGAN